MKQENGPNLDAHIKIVGWLLLASHVLFLIIGAFVFFLLVGIGIATGDSEAAGILGVTGTAVGLLMFLLALPGLAAGYGLLKRKSWGRILGVIVGVLSLMNFPLGTAVGVYTLWVLLQEDATEYFITPKFA